MRTCPRCSAQFPELIRVEQGMKLRLQETGTDANPPPEVCPNCYKEFSSNISQGAKLRAQENAKAHNRMVLWKNRFSLIKQAREKMQVKSMTEAAVFYEKYIRTLEICHDLNPGQLDPLMFNSPGKEKELEVLSTVYLDLIKIYDSNSRYTDRLNNVSQKLMRILPHCKNRADISRKIERHIKASKNPQIMKRIAGDVSKVSKGTGCFIATASFGANNTSELVIFYAFRDHVLQKSFAGRCFIKLYYFISPPMAQLISKHSFLASISRKILKPIAMLLQRTFNLKS